MPHVPGLTLRMRIAVEFDTPRAIVDGPFAGRRILHVTSGEFEGPALAGEVLAGGGDWILPRRDGSLELDIRFTLRTTTGELIYFRSSGLFVASETVTARLRQGENVAPDEYYFRTAIMFEAGSARLNHLNQALHVGSGQRTPAGMITHVFSLS